MVTQEPFTSGRTFLDRFRPLGRTAKASRAFKRRLQFAVTAARLP